MKSLLVPLALAAGLVFTAALFVIDPGLDTSVASLLYLGHNTFVAQTPFWEGLRRAVYWVPALVAAAMTLLYLARRLGLMRVWAPSGRGVLVLLVSFALGPGLLANLVLKDHSHRPRPYQTIGFGGDEPFRPFYRFDGACKRNCSFVSGEGAAAFWTIVPALLTPPPVRAVAVVASLAFGIAVAGLRMALGGHYLSDTLFAALLTFLVSWLTWVAVVRRAKHDRDPVGKAGPRPSGRTAARRSSPDRTARISH